MPMVFEYLIGALGLGLLYLGVKRVMDSEVMAAVKLALERYMFRGSLD